MNFIGSQPFNEDKWKMTTSVTVVVIYLFLYFLIQDYLEENSPTCILDVLIQQCDTDMKANHKDSLNTREVVGLCQDMFAAGMYCGQLGISTL